MTNTPKRPAAQASRTKESNRRRFIWLDQVMADPELPPAAFKVAYYFGQRFNPDEDGAAWPSLDTIAAAVALPRTVVRRAIGRLHQLGYLRIEAGCQGRGHSNRYWMIERQPDLFDSVKGPPAAQLSTAGKGPLRDLKGPLVNRKGPPAALTPSKNKPKTKEGNIYPRPGDADGGKEGGPPREESRAFAEFCDAFPRKGDTDAVRRAFDEAGDPGMLIAAAKRYAAERPCQPADQARYTLGPLRWLREKHWLDEPGGEIIDQAGNHLGNVVAMPRKRSQSNSERVAQRQAAREAGHDHLH